MQPRSPKEPLHALENTKRMLSLRHDVLPDTRDHRVATSAGATLRGLGAFTTTILGAGQSIFQVPIARPCCWRCRSAPARPPAGKHEAMRLVSAGFTVSCLHG